MHLCVAGFCNTSNNHDLNPSSPHPNPNPNLDPVYPKVHTVDISNFMNHSADPTCWFVDGGVEYEGVMVATRDLRPGDEITFDYATSEGVKSGIQIHARPSSTP